MTRFLLLTILAALLVGCTTTPQPKAIDGLRTIRFSGYDWWVKQNDQARGPGPNLFSNSEQSVWLDDDNRLHLTIEKRDGQWLCSEVVTMESLGYGTYTFELDSPVQDLDRNSVIGLFTWSDQNEQHHREIDVEVGRWGDPSNQLGQFVVQPYDHPGNMRRFAIPPGVRHTTFTFEWGPEDIKFRATAGRSPWLFGYELDRWTYDGPDLPTPGDENVRINFWMNGGDTPQSEERMELIVRRFRFVPRR